MYDNATLVMVAAGSLTLGCLLGAWALQRFAPERQNRKALEDHIQQLQRQQQSYQTQVNEHFDKTAGLLNQLASSYRDVHNHLAESARELGGGISPLQPLAEGRPVLEMEPGHQHVEPPLDYAPHTPGRKGALQEDFGLEKEATEEPEQPVIHGA